MIKVNSNNRLENNSSIKGTFDQFRNVKWGKKMNYQTRLWAYMKIMLIIC